MVVELGPWLQEFVREHGMPRDEYRELLSRLDALEKDISLIKEEMSGPRAEPGPMGAALRAELKQVRAEFRDQQAQMGAAVRAELRQMRAQLREEQGQMRAEFRQEQGQIRAEFRATEGQTRAEFREDLRQLRRETNGRLDLVNERITRLHR